MATAVIVAAKYDAATHSRSGEHILLAFPSFLFKHFSLFPGPVHHFIAMPATNNLLIERLTNLTPIFWTKNKYCTYLLYNCDVSMCDD